jgi:hypothetical protein
MSILKIKLTEIKDVEDFVKVLVPYYNVEMDLRSGRYIVNARSLLAIYSLDLKNPVDLVIHSEDEDLVKKIVNDISKYIAA